MTRHLHTWLSAALLISAAACGTEDDGDDVDNDPDGDGIASYAVSGTVHDFETGSAIDGVATVATDGLVPPPTVSVSGATFTIEDVPPYSVFDVLAGSPPAYRSTYNVAIQVDEADVSDVALFVVREAYLGELAAAFGVTPTFGTSIVIARVTGADGQPFAGVPAAAFELPATVAGPFFLDADRRPAPELASTSASGLVVLFDVQPGLFRVTAAADSGYAVTMPDAPVAATAVTLADLTVTDEGQVEVPQNVSFTNDVAPIFELRGCVLCHDGGGIGKDLGGLHLNGATEKMYRELAEEISPNTNTLRINLQAPETSLLLTMPSREDPPDAHPNASFASPADPDYQIILAWIREGALLN